MKSGIIALLSIGATLFCLEVYAYVWPSLFGIPLLLLAYLVMFAGLFVSLMFGFRRWRKLSPFWILPSILCAGILLATWFLAPPLGRRIADSRFKKNAKAYTSVVEGLQSGAIPCGSPDATDCTVPSRFAPSEVRKVLVSRCPGGIAHVEFLLDTRALLVHDGYLFKGSDDSCIAERMKPERRFYLRNVTGNWYHFSDQPGL
jgi:hypothetical protein